MARKVDPTRLGKGAPKVEQSDLEGDVAVLTIAGYEEDEIDDSTEKTGKRPLAWLTFEELGDKRLYLNVSQTRALIEKLGDDADRWIGEQVPVEKVTTTFGNEKFKKVAIMVDTDEWDEFISPKPKARGRRKPSRR